MVANVDYKDLVNKELFTLRDNMNTLVLDYKKMTSEEAVNNRESEEYEKYIKQYTEDINILTQMRKFAQDIADYCNKTLFAITKDAISKHVYDFD